MTSSIDLSIQKAGGWIDWAGSVATTHAPGHTSFTEQAGVLVPVLRQIRLDKKVTMMSEATFRRLWSEDHGEYSVFIGRNFAQLNIKVGEVNLADLLIQLLWARRGVFQVAKSVIALMSKYLSCEFVKSTPHNEINDVIDRAFSIFDSTSRDDLVIKKDILIRLMMNSSDNKLHLGNRLIVLDRLIQEFMVESDESYDVLLRECVERYCFCIDKLFEMEDDELPVGIDQRRMRKVRERLALVHFKRNLDPEVRKTMYMPPDHRRDLIRCIKALGGDSSRVGEIVGYVRESDFSEENTTFNLVGFCGASLLHALACSEFFTQLCLFHESEAFRFRCLALQVYLACPELPANEKLNRIAEAFELKSFADVDQVARYLRNGTFEWLKEVSEEGYGENLYLRALAIQLMPGVTSIEDQQEGAMQEVLALNDVDGEKVVEYMGHVMARGYLSVDLRLELLLTADTLLESSALKKVIPTPQGKAFVKELDYETFFLGESNERWGKVLELVREVKDLDVYKFLLRIINRKLNDGCGRNILDRLDELFYPIQDGSAQFVIDDCHALPLLDVIRPRLHALYT